MIVRGQNGVYFIYGLVFCGHWGNPTFHFEAVGRYMSDVNLTFVEYRVGLFTYLILGEEEI
jgi:hypothetical protein